MENSFSWQQSLNAKYLYKSAFLSNVNHLCEPLSRQITFSLFVLLLDEYHETHLVHIFMFLSLFDVDVENFTRNVYICACAKTFTVHSSLVILLFFSFLLSNKKNGFCLNRFNGNRKSNPNESKWHGIFMAMI